MTNFKNEKQHRLFFFSQYNTEHPAAPSWLWLFQWSGEHWTGKVRLPAAKKNWGQGVACPRSKKKGHAEVKFPEVNKNEKAFMLTLLSIVSLHTYSTHFCTSVRAEGKQQSCALRLHLHVFIYFLDTESTLIIISGHHSWTTFARTPSTYLKTRVAC